MVQGPGYMWVHRFDRSRAIKNRSLEGLIFQESGEKGYALLDGWESPRECVGGIWKKGHG